MYCPGLDYSGKNGKFCLHSLPYLQVVLRGQEKSTTPNDEFSDRGGLESAQQSPLVTSDDQLALTSGALDVDTRELQGYFSSVNGRQIMLSIIVFAEERCQVYFPYFFLLPSDSKTRSLHSCPTMKYHSDLIIDHVEEMSFRSLRLRWAFKLLLNRTALRKVLSAMPTSSNHDSPQNLPGCCLKVTSTVCTKTDSATVKDMHPFPYTTHIRFF